MRVQRRLETRYLDEVAPDLDSALRRVDECRAKKQPRSIAIVANATDVYAELVRRGVTPDLVTDQTSAHDPLNGYLPQGLTLDQAAALRTSDPDGYVRRARASMAVQVEAMVAMLRAGAHGFLGKESAPDDLLKAVHVILAGRRYLSPTMSELLISEIDNGGADRPIHQQLSKREFQIFCKLASGSSVSEIARELCLSVKTVSTYRSRVLEKMHFKTNADITSYALRNGLIQ